MRVFCDTSVLVAVALRTHSHHVSAKAALDRVRRGDDIGFASAHTLAETFSVLSRMPTKPKLEPQDVLDLLERDIIPHFVFVALQPRDYPKAIRDLVALGLGGGRIYDLLHLLAASKMTLDRIYTFNAQEWKALAPELATLICLPPPPCPPPGG
ncbi:MAG: type II toxin-antitoxin system VapC family toxin [Limisphaerales bacterium]